MEHGRALPTWNVTSVDILSLIVLVAVKLGRLHLIIRRSFVSLSELCQVHSHATWCGISAVCWQEIRADVIVLNDVKVRSSDRRALALLRRGRTVSLMGAGIGLSVCLGQRLGITEVNVAFRNLLGWTLDIHAILQVVIQGGIGPLLDHVHVFEHRFLAFGRCFALGSQVRLHHDAGLLHGEMLG